MILLLGSPILLFKGVKEGFTDDHIARQRLQETRLNRNSNDSHPRFINEVFFRGEYTKIIE